MSERTGGTAAETRPDADHARVGAIIVAVGAPGSEHWARPPLWSPLANVPLLAWTVHAFEAAAGVGVVVVAVPAGDVAETMALARKQGWRKLSAVVAAGPQRSDAVRAGLDALPAACEWVIVHDGARALVTPDLIETGLAAARVAGAASAYEPVKETIKRVRDGVVVETPARAALALLQTPQVFRRSLLADVLAVSPPDDDVPDEATMLLRRGMRVALFPGGHENIKVTAPDDLEIVEALLRGRLAET